MSNGWLGAILHKKKEDREQGAEESRVFSREEIDHSVKSFEEINGIFTDAEISLQIDRPILELYGSCMGKVLRDINPYSRAFVLTAVLHIGKLNDNDNSFLTDILREDLQVLSSHFSNRTRINDYNANIELKKLLKTLFYKRFIQYKVPLIEERSGEIFEHNIDVDAFVEQISDATDIWCIFANGTLLNQFYIFDDTDEQAHNLAHNLDMASKISYNTSTFGKYLTLLCSFCNMPLIYQYAQSLKGNSQMYERVLEQTEEGLGLEYPELYTYYRIEHPNLFLEGLTARELALVVNVAILSNNYQQSVRKADDELKKIGISVTELIYQTLAERKENESPYYTMLRVLKAPMWASLYRGDYDTQLDYLTCAINSLLFEHFPFPEWTVVLCESFGFKQELMRRAEQG